MTLHSLPLKDKSSYLSAQTNETDAHVVCDITLGGNSNNTKNLDLKNTVQLKIAAETFVVSTPTAFCLSVCPGFLKLPNQTSSSANLLLLSKATSNYVIRKKTGHI